MKLSRLMRYSGQMFDLDGTIAPPVNFLRDITLLPNYFRLKTGTLPLQPHAAKFLSNVKADKTKKMGLITNTPTIDDYLTGKVMNRDVSLSGIFDDIKITHGMKTDAILALLDKWEIRPENAILYGDQLRDAISAHDARTNFCRVGKNVDKWDAAEMAKISNLWVPNFGEIEI